MRFIFIFVFLVLFWSVSKGGVGDVYFCEEIQHIDFDKDGVRKVDLDKFEFKISDKIIEIESGVSRFSNKKYIIEYMGPYNGDNFISAYDISTKFVLKNDNLLFITNISYTDDVFFNVIADCSKIIELL